VAARLGWWWTAFFIIGGLFCVIFDTVGSGFWWMGVCFLVAGVGNLIGLLWWPGRIKHPPPRA